MSFTAIWVLMLCLVSSLHAGDMKIVRKSVNDANIQPSPTSNTTSNTSPPMPMMATAELVYTMLQKTANHSWEWGTQCQVILERYYPSLSVYSTTKRIPLKPEDIGTYPQELFNVLDPILQRRAPGEGPIIQDDAAGDPASLLPGVVVLGAASSRDPRGRTQQEYYTIAQEQIDFLLEKVPRTDKGAISHRVKEVQLWNDNTFMAPPSLSYWGAATCNITLLEMGYIQAKLYRDVLRDPETNTWRHILLGGWNEPSRWSTGNGWVVAGLMRIWAAMDNVDNEEMRAQAIPWKKDIVEMVIEIVVGAYAFQNPTSYLLPNRYAATNASYCEVSGTALIAAAAYRLAFADPSSITRLPMGKIDSARRAILANNIDLKTGIVSPVVDPLNWNNENPYDSSKASPEGQAFVVMMITAFEALQAKTGYTY